MESLFRYKCYENGYVELSEKARMLETLAFLEKVTVFKKYLIQKKFFFWKNSCSGEVPALKKYMF